MFRHLLFTLTALAALLGACDRVPPPTPQPQPPASETPTVKPPAPLGVPVIVDTDFGIDVDDVGALAVLHALADAGEATILGVVANVSDPYAAPAMDVINTYYGRPNIPLGVTSRPYYRRAHPYWRDPDPHFIRELAEAFPHDTGSAPDAVSVYRRTLAAQPDGSVTVISLGFLQNLADLMASPPDAHSPLSGMALIARKVKVLSIMGGHYPSSDRDLYLTGGPEISPDYAIRVLTAWPTQIVFNTGPTCQEVSNGHTLAARTPLDNPVRAAYTSFFGREGVGRTSWDLCSVLHAVRGLSDADGARVFDLRTDEHLVLYEDGFNEWVTPGNGRHLRLTRVMAAGELAARLEALLVQPPALR